MPTFLADLPLHALVVHAVVVLVPLAVLAAVAVTVWPAARRRFDWLAVAVATAATPVATSTGEALRDRLAPEPAITTHAELGDQLLVLVAPMTIALIGFVLLTRHTRRTGGSGAKVGGQAPLGTARDRRTRGGSRGARGGLGGAGRADRRLRCACRLAQHALRDPNPLHVTIDYGTEPILEQSPS